MDWTHLRTSKVVGRKEYVCAWCNEAILKDTEHFYTCGKMYGYFQVTRLHVECERAFENSNQTEILDMGGWTFGEQIRGEPIL